MSKSSFICFSMLLMNVALAFGNINYIDIHKIDTGEKYLTSFSYVKENQAFYDHWSPEWKYELKKEVLISQLKEAYTVFNSIPDKNTELLLLMADISHYLYNLEVSSEYQTALDNYQAAIRKSPDDYRGYWFLANHYALSDNAIKGVEMFLKAEKILPTVKPADFWEEYVKAMAFANMPSHAIYSMDKTRSILGREGNTENVLGEGILKQLGDANRNSNYKKEELWYASKGEKVAFICRPLGIKLLIDSTWQVSPFDYKNHACGFTIEPPTVKSKKGKEIGFSIAVLMKVANDSDKLEDYINNISGKYQNKTKIQFSEKYKDLIAYDIKDKSIYKNWGGSHLYSIGIERTAPEYPGLMLENPVALPHMETGKVNFFTATGGKTRFKGRIFYTILLDTCEDIHDQSFEIFKTFFENQLVIE
ncbi:MAG: hypothetical protein PHT07_09900 [Paludibacter sp.]|nr:hypothetical protein [Paludibacter sp.]